MTNFAKMDPLKLTVSLPATQFAPTTSIFESASLNETTSLLSVRRLPELGSSERTRKRVHVPADESATVKVSIISMQSVHALGTQNEIL